MGVQIETRRSSDGVILSVAESFDSTTMDTADEAIARILENHHSSVTLNLYECEYIDEAALGRLIEFGQILREQGRDFEVYVRPMSFVSYRTQGLPLVAQVPEDFARNGEERLAERRAKRLEKWRAEKPRPKYALPYGAKLPDNAAGSEKEQASGATHQAGDRESFSIDFKRVSALAGKDERVIERIWQTYTEFLNEGLFKTAPDGSADTQLSLDASLVAKNLRLNPKVVRQVIESVSTYLMEVFDSE